MSECACESVCESVSVHVCVTAPAAPLPPLEDGSCYVPPPLDTPVGPFRLLRGLGGGARSSQGLATAQPPATSCDLPSCCPHPAPAPLSWGCLRNNLLPLVVRPGLWRKLDTVTILGSDLSGEAREGLQAWLDRVPPPLGRLSRNMLAGAGKHEEGRYVAFPRGGGGLCPCPT